MYTSEDCKVQFIPHQIRQDDLQALQDFFFVLSSKIISDEQDVPAEFPNLPKCS
jgi:hypothetical protein